jgi:hypothetical protein
MPGDVGALPPADDDGDMPVGLFVISDERDDEVIQPLDLRVEELHAAAELAQRHAGRVISGTITRRAGHRAP